MAHPFDADEDGGSPVAPDTSHAQLVSGAPPSTSTPKKNSPPRWMRTGCQSKQGGKINITITSQAPSLEFALPASKPILKRKRPAKVRQGARNRNRGKKKRLPGSSVQAFFGSLLGCQIRLRKSSHFLIGQTISITRYGPRLLRGHFPGQLPAHQTTLHCLNLTDQFLQKKQRRPPDPVF